MARIYLKSTGPERWADYLAEPIKHWQTGYSAKTLAHSWEDADGFPAEIQAALNASEYLAGLELLLAIPEHQVPLPGGSRPTQSDLWALGRAGNEIVSVAVEGKVAEPFGPTLAEWQAEASSGKVARLQYLRDQLSLSEPPPGTIRYQLLHRTVAPLIEARRFGATHAVMLVHSFSKTNEWFEDYAAFALLFGIAAVPNTIARVGERGGINLHIGWVSGNPDYLAR